MAVELRPVQPLEAERRPLLAHLLRQPQTDERVDERAAAERAPGEDAHAARLRPEQAAVEVRAGAVVQLELEQVGLARVGALLEHDDRPSRLLQSSGDHRAAGA